MGDFYCISGFRGKGSPNVRFWCKTFSPLALAPPGEDGISVGLTIRVRRNVFILIIFALPFGQTSAL